MLGPWKGEARGAWLPGRARGGRGRRRISFSSGSSGSQGWQAEDQEMGMREPRTGSESEALALSYAPFATIRKYVGFFEIVAG